MTKVYSLMSTGIEELDNMVQGIRPGDNVVWQVDSIEDYIKFVQPYSIDVYKKGGKLVYFRFADHKYLLPKNVKADVYTLSPEKGFETFIASIFKVIEKYGEETYYVFDCLSELTADWYSDRMLANFFMLTCPYLYDYNTATYFALFRNLHTTQTINAIHDTAQVVIDIYNKNNELFLQPLKVYKRHNPTMYMLHQWKNKKFEPVKSSVIISEILKEIPHPWLDFSISNQDIWNRTLNRASEIQKEIDTGKSLKKEYEKYYLRLLKMMVTREERLLKLAKKYFKLSDLIEIGKHLIGTGLIGGKTVGMLLARAIIKKENKKLSDKLEPHDSFYIGSDVFYTYLIKSGCWWVRWKQRHTEDFLDGLDEAKHRLLTGKFPNDIQSQFREILNYFGQSPIIVRSSSLLEDAYGNSFSGKYESVFCANQGTPQERLEGFMNAVKQVYASTMNQETLIYRQQRGLLDRDEQMALLIQRVSGSVNAQYFFPQIAGVGFSYNLYAWEKSIDPKEGMLRLVFGLGTRAVDRHDDDYTRIVALNNPQKRPEANFDEVKKYAQRKVDVLDLVQNTLVSSYFSDIVNEVSGLKLDIYANKDSQTNSWIITFENLFSETDFVKTISKILKILQKAYDYPVDIEFTTNFMENGKYKINLLQCRPFQVKRGIGIIKEPGNIKKENLILKTKGPIIGSSRHTKIDRLIYVVASKYSKLSVNDRYQTARIIGKLNSLEKDKEKIIMLVGPGRWATTSPSLGVPVHISEINNVSVICEVAEMREGLIPDVSLGTHFFNDLVELEMLYMAFYPKQKDNFINREFLEKFPNQLNKLMPEAAKLCEVIQVIDFNNDNNNQQMYLNVNSVEQKGICYLEKRD
ncbi:PEP/pyruvate-binding domain-containing protein [Candidatus Margulisiibacteriota bacterium]